ncbi:glutaminase A [Ancylobacter lacus]|uniref:glutaminase A n=1 Tax=Ancylobacter lacus TaxID=2579970 RepID=UPI001BCC02BE|nr:glutaminase A [Ancylobacter lacus]MBS7540863.1 glutaminase A [Ancylobacter lacus]
MTQLFDAVAQGGVTSRQAILARMAEAGIGPDDHRIAGTCRKLDALGDAAIDRAGFAELIGDELLTVSRIFRRQLIIPDWQDFCHAIRGIYDEVAPDRSGANADYIPILRDADPEKWGVSICSIDGQRFSCGDVDIYHSIQSVSKPLTYSFALLREGEEFTSRFVGTEPSGRPFNALDLLPDMRPFNPCVNAGAIMTAGIVASGSPEKSAREVTYDIMAMWSGLSGGIAEVRFSEETMLSERSTAHNNYAISYLLQGRKGLPRDVDLHKMLEVYLSCCSIEMTCEMLSVAAATLANGGVCPLTGEQVLPTELVKKTLAVMQFAGMYDNAGVFTLQVGLPAKSGVAGAILVVVPNLMGFATFSPRLDSYGNSVRGVAFCRKLVERFTFHVYDSLSGGRTGCKLDPRESQHNRKQRDLSDLKWALAHGDRSARKVHDLLLETMIDICIADGDVEDDELDIIANTLDTIIGSRIAPAQLRVLSEARLAQGSAPFDGLLALLGRECPTLDDNVRGLLLEAAFRVSCADGEIEPEEYARLAGIAGALGVHKGILDIQVDRFRRGATL